jgi:hypothetical protein
MVELRQSPVGQAIRDIWSECIFGDLNTNRCVLFANLVRGEITCEPIPCFGATNTAQQNEGHWFLFFSFSLFLFFSFSLFLFFSFSLFLFFSFSLFLFFSFSLFLFFSLSLSVSRYLSVSLNSKVVPELFKSSPLGRD